MNKARRSSDEWFKIWDKIISIEDKLSRVSLSERSGASIWIIKALQSDWMDKNNNIAWNGNKFYRFNLSLSSHAHTQHTFSDDDKEDMK